jgi:hypothetical protein
LYYFSICTGMHLSLLLSMTNMYVIIYTATIKS